LTTYGSSARKAIEMKDVFFKTKESIMSMNLRPSDLNAESDVLEDEQGQKSPSLSQVAYRRLRHEVISGVLRPNERLVEVELSERLGMSRTPVRDALGRLATDGLISRGKRGWTVHEYTREELLRIYETRAALEGYAARLCALRASDEEFEAMTRILESAPDDVESASPDFRVEQNEEFHSAVIRGCGNPRLIELIERNAEFYFNHRAVQMYTSDELQRSLDGHLELFAALVARDADAAERALREHLFESVAVLLTKGRW
jgi:DNA-binding GntR family transcriptional regulator